MRINEVKEGMFVTHSAYGKGKILAVNTFFRYVKVEFGEETNEKLIKRIFPKALESFEDIKAVDNEYSEAVDETAPIVDVEQSNNVDSFDNEGEVTQEDDDYVFPITLNRVPLDEIKKKVKELIAQDGWNYGTPTVSAILLGVRSKPIISRGLDSNVLFGFFANKNVAEVDVSLAIDSLLRDASPTIVKDRSSGILKLKEPTKTKIIQPKIEAVLKSSKSKEEKFVDNLRKENGRLLSWFDQVSNKANPKAKKVSEKSYYGYKTENGKYWIALRGRTYSELVFRYRLGKDGDVQTAYLNERTKNYIEHLINVVGKYR